MRCNDIAAIMDEHRAAHLTAAERCAVDAHLSACEACGAAWQAHAELLELRLPPTPAELLDRVVAATTRPSAQPRRARAPFVIASVLLAGTALAAVTATVLSTIGRSPESAARGAAPIPAAEPTSAVSAAGLPGVETAPPPTEQRSTSVELVEVAEDGIPITRKPPNYPPSALEQRLEGSVQVRFDITAAGVVENVSVVDSTDPRFEAPALTAVSTWRYLPRIAAGKRVAAPNIHTIIRFALGPEPEAGARPTETQAVDETAREAYRSYAEFSAGLEVAVDRFAADDLRGTELQLDELHALYENDGFRGTLWNFYGYLYTVERNYDRAIEAYEAGIAAYTRAGSPDQARWVPLANLYFARHQYDVALEKLLTYKEQRALYRTQRGLDPGQPNETVEAFIERLRALGVTEETLSQSR